MKIETINKESEIATAVKYDAVDFTNMGGVMDEGYGRLMAHLAKCGKEMAGVPYCKYYNGSKDNMVFDIELGLPVSEYLPEGDGIYMTKTCTGKAITATHKGSYKDIEKTYAPMMQYLADNNIESTGIYYDYYVNDPDTTEESELLTKIIFPLK